MFNSVLFERNLDALLLLDADEKIIQVNSRAVQFYGYSKKELRELHISSLQPPGKWDGKIRPDLETASENCCREILHRRKDGSVFPAEITSQPIQFLDHPFILLIIRDISKQKSNEKALQESEARYRDLFEKSPIGLLKCDSKGNIKDINRCGLDILGFTAQEDINNLRDVTSHYRSIYEIIKNLVTVFNLGISVSNEIEIKTRPDKKIWLNYRANPVTDNDGQVVEAIIAFEDISLRKEVENKIKFLNFHDSLTGVYNRAFLEEEIKRLDVPRQLPISVIVGDLNGLKVVNDAFGHEQGDRLIQTIVEILKNCCRREDILARWGGDEFVILLPHTDAKRAKSICERIRKACHESDYACIEPSIALGVASKETKETDIFKIISIAEDIMYRNKLLERSSIRNSIMNSLEVTLHERTHETREHAERLWKLSVKFGNALGLTDDEMDRLALLAKLHDIGKIAIPDEILSKPGRLTYEEWEIIKKHPEIGCRITQSSHELAAIAEEVLTHHERWDGSGYPKGLKGEEIPILARILTIIDSYDVMTHERSYKTARAHSEALKEIVRCAGTQFDPQLVKTFLNLDFD